MDKTKKSSAPKSPIFDTTPDIKRQVVEFLPDKEETDFHTIGGSQVTTDLRSILSFAGTGRYPRGTKDTSVEVKTSKLGNMTLKYKSKYKKNTDIEFTIDNYAKIFSKQDKTTKKILTFLLEESNRQNNPEDIIFKVQDLVDLGIYANIDSARKGLDTAMEKLTSVKINGSLKHGNVTIDKRIAVIFFDYTREKYSGYAKVSRNRNLSMGVVAKFITLFPSWAYPLNVKAFSLVEFIMTQARQNTELIFEKGEFNIGLRVINNALGQPDALETKNPQRDIIEPILKAIEEIEIAKDEARSKGFEITPIIEGLEEYLSGEKVMNVNTFLDGYISVKTYGNVLKYFSKLGEVNITKKKEAKKKEEKRLEKIKEKQLERKVSGDE